MGITDHSYLEFWDTNDANHYPYYAGIMDSDKNSQFSKAFYKHVKAGLSTKQVEDWVDTQLHGSFRNGACRQARNLFKKEDGSYIKIPVMDGPTSEKNSDVEFYLDQLSTDESILPMDFQRQSYRGYWALATFSHKPQKKEPIAIDEDLFDELYEKCEGMPTNETYTSCRATVKRNYEITKSMVASTANTTTIEPTTAAQSGGRRELSAPTRSAPNCWRETTRWYYYNGGRKRYKVRPYYYSKCISPNPCTAPDPSSFSVNRPTPIAYDYSVTVDGVTFGFNMESEVATSTQGAWTKKTRKTTQCYRYTEYQKERKKWQWRGWRWRKVSYYTPSHTGGWRRLWYRSRIVSEYKRGRPTVTKTLKTTLFARGASRLLSLSAFTQYLSAKGSLTLESRDLGKPEVKGRFELEYGVGRRFCATAWGGTGGAKFVAEAYIGGGTTITKDGPSLDLYGGLRGDIGAFRRTWWHKCSCGHKPALGKCKRAVGGNIDGRLYVKFYNMGCRKVTNLDFGFRAQISVGLSGVYSFNFERNWVIAKGVKVGKKWNC